MGNSPPYYRYLCHKKGIYEAVDRQCPRQDERRHNKPDGSWLPKVGENYPGAISFWTEKGAAKYISCGLKDWHSSVVNGEVELIVASLKTKPLYEDDYQVIAHPNDFLILDQMDLNLPIRPYRERDSLEEITTLVRTAYKVLADKGFRYWGTFQSVEDTEKRLSEGAPFVVEKDQRIIGTITLKWEHRGWEETPWYDREEVCYFSQFAVLPEYQKSGLGSQMMTFIEEEAKLRGFREIALDTCEDAESLILYYKKRGYRFVESIQWDPKVVNYRSVVLSKSLT